MSSFRMHEMVGHLDGLSQRYAARSSIKIGFVTAYDPVNYAVRVRLEPESSANEQAGVKDPVVETQWMPVFRAYGGNGWGMVAPPNANPAPPYGDQCFILFADGFQHGIALIGTFNDVEKVYTDRTPVGDLLHPVQATQQTNHDAQPAPNELMFVHPNGAWAKLKNNGDVQIFSKPNGSGSSAALLLQHDGSIFLEDGGGNFVKLTGGNGLNQITIAQVNGSPDTTITMDNDGHFKVNCPGNFVIDCIPGSGVTVKAVGNQATVSGSQVYLAGGNASIGGLSSRGVVTLVDLQAVVAQINATFATKLNGSGSPGAVVAQASTTVFSAD